MKSLVLALALFSWLHGGHYPIDKASNSLVRIEGTRFVAGHEPYDYYCTGSVVGYHRVLTAFHCAGANLSADGKPATILKVDPYNDLMLLGAESDRPAIELREEPVKMREELTGIGYGGGFPHMIEITGPVRAINEQHSADEAPMIFIQGEYVRGMSGGPVVDKKGRMVGMAQQGGEGLGCGVGMVPIFALLQE